MPPLEPEPWKDIRSSRAYGPVCPQGVRTGWASDEMAFAFDWDDGSSGRRLSQVEYLAPGLTDGVKRPVMVGFTEEGIQQDRLRNCLRTMAQHWQQKEMWSLISVNHRANILGFLDLSAFGEKYAQSGNAGMLDNCGGASMD